MNNTNGSISATENIAFNHVVFPTFLIIMGFVMASLAAYIVFKFVRVCVHYKRNQDKRKRYLLRQAQENRIWL